MSSSTCSMVVPASAEADDAVVVVHDRVETVFDHCSTALYRFFAVRVGHGPLADDLMQQLWLQACKAPAAIPTDELEFWLRRVAKNLLNDHWRRVSRRPQHVALDSPRVSGELASTIDAGQLPDEMLQRREVVDQLTLALTELPSADQELIVMHYHQDRSFQEMGELLSISERAVEGRMYRARQKLRQVLADRGLESPQ